VGKRWPSARASGREIAGSECDDGAHAGPADNKNLRALDAILSGGADACNVVVRCNAGIHPNEGRRLSKAVRDAVEHQVPQFVAAEVSKNVRQLQHLMTMNTKSVENEGQGIHTAQAWMRTRAEKNSELFWLRLQTAGNHGKDSGA